MDGNTTLTSLRQMCNEIDEGRQVRRLSWDRAKRVLVPLVGPALISLSLGLGGCPETFDEPDPGAVALYSAPEPVHMIVELCDDRRDNDNDGFVDCADTDCAQAAFCNAVPEYGFPMPENNPGDPAKPPDGTNPGVENMPEDPGEFVTMYGRPFQSGEPDGSITEPSDPGEVGSMYGRPFGSRP